MLWYRYNPEEYLYLLMHLAIDEDTIHGVYTSLEAAQEGYIKKQREGYAEWHTYDLDLKILRAPADVLIYNHWDLPEMPLPQIF